MSDVCVQTYQAEVKHFLGWNYLFHVIEGGFISGGMAFVSANTILPRLVEILNGPIWMISLMPVLLSLGHFFPPVLTAHRVEKLHRVKPFVMFTAVFARLPFFIAGLVLMVWGQYRFLALTVIILVPLLSGLAGGFSMTAWQELVIKTIPDNRRSSLFASRQIFSSGIGMAAGSVITRILNQNSGIEGYGILHLIPFGFMLLSLFFFAMVHETDLVPQHRATSVTLMENLRQMPQLLRRASRFNHYLMSRSLMNGIFIMTPFMAIHVLRVLNKPDSFMGSLVTLQMAGAITGNVVAGYLGDRFGGKIPMLLSRFLFTVTSLWAAFTHHEWAFLTIFFLYGLALFMNQVGTATMSLEICPNERRPTYLAIIAFFTAATMLGVSLLGAALWKISASFSLLALTTMVLQIVSIIYLLRIPEPRRESPVL
jgi:MFS family permease